MEHIEISLQTSFLDVPTELLVNIFKFLSLENIAQCGTVCSQFREASMDSSLYRDIIIKTKQSPKFIEWLLKRATHPRTLHCFSLELSTQIVQCHADKWRNLETLYLFYVDLREIDSLPLVELTAIELSTCKIKHHLLEKLLKNNSKLKKLRLETIECFCEQCAIGDEHWALISLRHLTESSRLEELSITAPDHSLVGLEQLSCCVNLKIFELSQGIWTMLRSDIWQLRENPPKLKMGAMQEIALNCRALEDIKFVALDYVTNELILNFVKSCPQLRTLYFHKLAGLSEISCIEAIKSLPNLEFLHISFCRQFGDNSLAMLSSTAQDFNPGLSLKFVPFSF